MQNELFPLHIYQTNASHKLIEPLLLILIAKEIVKIIFNTLNCFFLPFFEHFSFLSECFENIWRNILKSNKIIENID